MTKPFFGPGAWPDPWNPDGQSPNTMIQSHELDRTAELSSSGHIRQAKSMCKSHLEYHSLTFQRLILLTRDLYSDLFSPNQQRCFCARDHDHGTRATQCSPFFHQGPSRSRPRCHNSERRRTGRCYAALYDRYYLALPAIFIYVLWEKTISSASGCGMWSGPSLLETLSYSAEGPFSR